MEKDIFKRIKNYILQPLNLCIISLSGLSIGAVISRSSDNPEVLLNIAFSLSLIILVNTFIPWLLSYYKIKVLNTKDSIISSLILFLVMDPNQSIVNIVLIAASVLLIRLFIRYKNSPIFNPLSAGIIAVVLLDILIPLKPFISWWGASFSPRLTDFNISITVLPVLIFGAYLAYRFRKLTIVFASFILMSIFFFIYQTIVLQTGVSELLNIYVYSFLEGTTIFALLIMLVEPKTSPIKKDLQIYYSIVFASIWIILIILKISNALILAILAANLFNFIVKYLSFKIPKKAPAVSNPPPQIRKELPDPTLINKNVSVPIVNQENNSSPTYKVKAETESIPVQKAVTELPKDSISLPNDFVIK